VKSFACRLLACAAALVICLLVLFSTGDAETMYGFGCSIDGRGATFPPTPFDVSGVDAAHQGDIGRGPFLCGLFAFRLLIV